MVITRIHCMMTSSFNALLVLCEGNSPATDEFPSQRPVTRSFDVFFGLRLNKQLSKPSRSRSFETPSCSLWRHNNGLQRNQCVPESSIVSLDRPNLADKQRVLMHGHQGWNVRHGLCHIYMIYVYIWVVHSFCLFCCLFIIVTTQFVALYEPCKPKPKPKPSTYDTRTTTPWQRSKFRYLDRSQSNKYAINMQIQTISVSK